PRPPVRPASLAFHAAPTPAAGPALAYAGTSAGAGLPFPTSGQTVSLAAAPAAPPSATAVAALTPAAAPAEPEAETGPKLPLPPRRPVEFRHFVIRKAAPPVPQTAAATPEPAAATPGQ
ncbi:hypothetical protein SQ03_28865, partial [Methylobacterium platani JCM 14648]